LELVLGRGVEVMLGVCGCGGVVAFCVVGAAVGGRGGRSKIALTGGRGVAASWLRNMVEDRVRGRCGPVGVTTAREASGRPGVGGPARGGVGEICGELGHSGVQLEVGVLVVGVRGLVVGVVGGVEGGGGGGGCRAACLGKHC